MGMPLGLMLNLMTIIIQEIWVADSPKAQL